MTASHWLHLGCLAYYEDEGSAVPCVVTDLKAVPKGLFVATVKTTTATRRYKKNTELKITTSIEQARQGHGVYPRTAAYMRGGNWTVSYFLVDFKEKVKANG